MTLLVQMAGDPASGKSTLARTIGRALGAVVLDKDVIKVAALRAGAPEELAAPLAYEAFFDLARDLLRQGHSVILDSPAFFPSIPQSGQSLAIEADAAYRIIECTCGDPARVASRLHSRPRLVSQPAGPSDPSARPGTAPLTHPRLTVDTSRPLDQCLAEALAYLRHDQS